MPGTELEVLPHRLALVVVELGAEDVDEADLPVLRDGRLDRGQDDVLVVLPLDVVDRLETEDADGHVTKKPDHVPTLGSLPGDVKHNRRGFARQSRRVTLGG